LLSINFRKLFRGDSKILLSFFFLFLTVNLVTAQVHAFPYRLSQQKKSDAAKGVPSIYHPAAQARHYKEISRYVVLSDGTKVAVEIYLPEPLKPGEKLPTMFEQSRYWRVVDLKFPFNKIYARPLSLYRWEFITHGYAWVAIDTRGAGASFGSQPWEFSPLHVADSKEIMDWIVAQPWSNGKIATIGHSYSGNLAEFALLNKHPAVKAAAILSSSFDLYTDILRPGGIPLQPFFHEWEDFTKQFDQNQIPGNLSKYKPLMKKIKPVEGDKNREQLRQALIEHKDNAALNVLDKINFRDDKVFQIALSDGQKPTPLIDRCLSMLKERLGQDALDKGIEVVSPTGYWQEIDKMNVPMYFGSGWEEGTNANAAIKRFMNYTVPGDKLILGPWDHNLFNISPFTRGGLTRFRLDRELLKFFDCHLKGETAGIANDKPVHYYTLGEEKWHGCDKWPPPNKPMTLFLASNHQLSAATGGTAGGDVYRIDPQAETGHDGRWDCLMGNVLLRPYPQRKAQDKRLLVYDSQPLTESRSIAGHPAIKVFLKPNGDDCTLFAYLEDVTPTGAVHYVTEGQLLCGNRLVATEQHQPYKTVLPTRSFLAKDYRPLAPNEVTPIDLELLPIAYQFKKGHRIRLSLAGVDKAHFIAPPFAHLSTQFEVRWGAQSPSELSLPIDENKM
jgi:uncharacterized protein